MVKRYNCYIGTSGWFYQWNKEKSLEWYINNTGFNAIELNASFYRFPFPNQVKNWSKIGSSLRWSIKVSRRITHLHKFSLENCKEIWERFYELFQPLDKYIDFYLFQAHPNFTDENKNLIKEFSDLTDLKNRFAFEPRHLSWFNKKNVNWFKKNRLNLVSVDSPKINNAIFNNKGLIYLRMHGRKKWYSHNYTDEELIEIKCNIISLGEIKNIYIFFNNDHDMLENAMRMQSLLLM